MNNMYSVAYLITDEQQKRLEYLAEVLNSKTDENGNKVFENDFNAESVFSSMMTLGSSLEIDERLNSFERFIK